MPKDGWAVVTVRKQPHDLAVEFVQKLNQGRMYQKDKVSLGDFASQAILEKLEREQQ